MGNKLFGVDISKLVADNIGPGVLDATLTVVTPGTRSLTDPTAGTVPTTVDHACKGFIDTQRVRNFDGTLVEDGTKKLVLIGDTINGGATAPSVGDQVTLEGAVYRIEVVDRDPAAATYTLIGRAV